jgi:hypothetical protein
LFKNNIIEMLSCMVCCEKEVLRPLLSALAAYSTCTAVWAFGKEKCQVQLVVINIRVLGQLIKIFIF